MAHYARLFLAASAIGFGNVVTQYVAPASCEESLNSVMIPGTDLSPAVMPPETVAPRTCHRRNRRAILLHRPRLIRAGCHFGHLLPVHCATIAGVSVS